VTFHYRKDLDPQAIPQFGLVAEQVEKVNPDLVARDDQGKPYTVRYEVVNAMLLNEFLKEHRKVEEQGQKEREQGSQLAKQDRRVQELEATVTQLQSALKAQAAQIQKVSDQLRKQAPAPRVVMGNRESRRSGLSANTPLQFPDSQSRQDQAPCCIITICAVARGFERGVVRWIIGLTATATFQRIPGPGLARPPGENRAA
jgi:hypothetical protein